MNTKNIWTFFSNISAIIVHSFPFFFQVLLRQDMYFCLCMYIESTCTYKSMFVCLWVWLPKPEKGGRFPEGGVAGALDSIDAWKQ